MTKKYYIYLVIIGLFILLFSCKNDEDKVFMLSVPFAPTIQTVPDLTLKRANATNTLQFVGTAVDPGFTASANYFLEACATGTNFADVVTIFSGTQDTLMEITISDLNTILLKKFTADASTSVDFRIRSVLVVDAGTGAPGTSTDPFEYISAIKTASVTPYGLPRLDLIDSGTTQKIESTLGDGSYTGFVKLDSSKPFTLKDPDTNIVYGASGSALAVNGSGITASASGWYKLTVNTTELTYSLEAYMIGLIGSATPNGWNSPDQKMDYDSATGTWKITITLVDGDIKFRLNDGWAWNLGGTTTNLVHNGDNITVTAGTYTITLTITNYTQGSEAGTFTIVKV
jgi:starch-binding outer membrane protein SusE/F